MDLKFLFKTSSRAYMLFAATLTCYQINIFLCYKLKKPLILYLHLVAWQVNLEGNTRKYL